MAEPRPLDVQLAALCKQLKHPSEKKRTTAASTLWDIALRGEDEKRAVGDSGCIPHLVDMVLPATGLSTSTQMMAAGVIGMACEGVARNQQVAVKVDAIPALVAAMQAKEGHAELNEYVMGAFWSLSAYDRGLQQMLTSNAVPHIVRVLRTGTADSKDYAAVTLFRLLQTTEGAKQISQCNVIPPLADMLRDGESEAQEKAVSLLWELTTHEDNRVVMVKENIIALLVSLLKQQASLKCQTQILGVLLRLSLIGPDVAKEIITSEGMSPLVRLLLQRTSPEALEMSAGILSVLAEDFDNQAAMGRVGATAGLVDVLQNGLPRARQHAAVALCWLSSHDEQHNLLLADSSVIQTVVRLLVDTLRSREYPIDEESTIAAVHSLAITTEHHHALIDGNIIPPLVARLGEDVNDQVKEYAAVTLHSLALEPAAKTLIAQSGAIPMLILLLSTGRPEAQSYAAGVLWNLALDERLCESIGREGAIGFLLKLLANATAAENAAGALCVLAGNAENLDVLLSTPTSGGEPPIGLLVSLLRMGTPEAQEHAAGALWKLATKSRRAHALVSKADGISALVKLMSEQGTETAAGALSQLASSCLCRVRMMECDAIVPLVAMLRASKPAARFTACDALSALARDDQDCRAAMLVAKVSPTIVSLLQSSSNSGRGRFAELVAVLAENDEAARADLSDSGALAALLMAVESIASIEVPEGKALSNSKLNTLGHLANAIRCLSNHNSVVQETVVRARIVQHYKPLLLPTTPAKAKEQATKALYQLAAYLPVQSDISKFGLSDFLADVATGGPTDDAKKHASATLWLLVNDDSSAKKAAGIKRRPSSKKAASRQASSAK